MTTIIGSCIIALTLLIWFRSDAYIEYCKLFRLNWLSFYKDFLEKKKEDISLEYLHYLRRDHDCFLVRLITCPICLSVWIGTSICLVGVLMTTSIASMLLMPVMVVVGLLLFTTIDRLLG